MTPKTVPRLGIVVVAMAMAAAQPLSAAERHRHEQRYDAIDTARRAPLKDCTRFNGRWGYYGNPWCTPAEQRAFDRWEAHFIARRQSVR